MGGANDVHKAQLCVSVTGAICDCDLDRRGQGYRDVFTTSLKQI
jgi:hypothetical protein